MTDATDQLARRGFTDRAWEMDEGIHDKTIEQAADGTTVAVAGWASFDPHPAGARRPSRRAQT